MRDRIGAEAQPIITVHPAEPSILATSAITLRPSGKSSSSPPWDLGA